MDRLTNLKRIGERSTPWDVIVIGGGATGVGCALDAASRGLDVLLLEQHDLGKGTSSRSTKLIHGGVRYLRQGDISLVREALLERSILLQNAPHVVHTAEFVVPCYSTFDKLFYAAGLKGYDLLAGKHRIGASQILSKAETNQRLPSIKQNGLAGGVLYHDGQFDDTRLLIDMAAAADFHGACIVNYARVESFISEGGRIAGVHFVDELSGERLSAASRSVINAAGIFCDSVREMSDKDAERTTTFAQGSHIVLDRRFLPSDTAIMIPKTRDGRVLFCIPWHGHVLIGTTDTPVNSALLEPEALEAEIDFILETAGQYLSEQPLRSDILSVFAGIRPLVRRAGARNTAALSRSHELFVDTNGLITITGGKWTTYRRMAEDAVSKAVKMSGLRAGECITRDLAIPAPSAADPGEATLHPRLSYTHGDVVRAVRHEMAQTVEDVLARRTRALFLDAKASIESAADTAEIMAKERGAGEEWRKAETERFTGLAENYLLIG